MDRILNGPTSEVWIDPWVQYLKSDVGGPAVKFHCKTPVKSLVFDPASDRIIGVILGNSAAPVSDSEAFYVAAVPVEAMIDILANTPEILEHSPSLKLLPKLQVSWMSGLVCYLRKRDVPMCPGHVVYLNSNWALTSISQNQFWEKKIDQYGKPDIKGVISVIISDWFEPGNHSGRPACEAEHHADVERETFLEIQDHIKAAAGVDLDEKNIAGWFVDPALIFHKHLLGLMPAGEFVERRKRPSPSSADLNVVLVDKNKDPLFINTVGSWPWRPTERTGIANLFLASDYIKTNTDLATMEGANEAARRAVNGVLDAAQSTCRRCEIFEFDEPAPLAPFKAIDKRLFDLGLPHPSTFGDPLAYLGATATRQRRERGAR